MKSFVHIKLRPRWVVVALVIVLALVVYLLHSQHLSPEKHKSGTAVHHIAIK